MATRLELPKFQAFDSNGDPLTGGLLYTYVVGTTTPKATYTDRDAGTPQANPIVLNSRGEADSDIYGTGYYKLVLKTSGGTTIYTIDSIRGVNELAFTSIDDYSGDLDAAVTAIGATETTLYIDSAATMSTNTTVPATTLIKVLKGGSIDQSTYTLTLNGVIEAGPYEVFTGTGTVNINANDEIYADWFGSTKDKATLSDMMSMLGSSNLYRVKLSAQTWTIDDDVTITDNFEVIVPHGCDIAVSNTKTFTVSGFVNTGIYTIFSGSGTAVLSGNTEFYPEWFGDVDGTADEVQINLATVCAGVNGGTVHLLPKDYTIAATINVYDCVHLKGAGDSYNGSGTGSNGTVLSNGANVPAITVSGDTGYGFEISDFHIAGNSGTDDGIYLYQSNSKVPRTSRIHDISMLNIGRDGVRIDGASYVELNNITVHSAGANGFNILDVTASPLQEFISFENCRTSSSTTAGMNITSGANIYLTRCDFDLDAIGLYISGDAFQIHVRECSFSKSTTYGIQIAADDGYLARLFFRDNYIYMTGTNAAEIALYIHRDAGDLYGVTDTIIDGLDIAKDGATTPTSTITIDDVFLRSKLINVKDAASATANNVTLPVDQTFEYSSLYSQSMVVLDDDATPSVAGGRAFQSGGTTTITDFDDGVNGQIITFIAAHAITITDGTNIFLNSSANFVMAATDTLTLICKSDNKWYEIGRSDNT